jgi:hypothetical protein
MMKNFNTLASLASLPVTDELIHFYRLVGQECANMCGSQNDQKNILKHFELPYTDGPTHYQNKTYQETQYSWSKHYIKEETK